MGRRANPLFAMVIAVMVSGCTSGETATSASPVAPAPTPTADAATGSITGTVVDDEQAPVVGASVGLPRTNTDTLTDDAGRFTFNELEPGSYVVHASRLGFDAAARKVDVQAGEIATITLVLKPIAILNDSYTITIPKVSLIVFGNAWTQFATQQANVSGTHDATCQGCQPIIYFNPKPAAALVESLWTCGCQPYVNQDVWIKYLKDWTTGATLDGTVLINTYLSNREQFFWSETQAKNLKTAKDNRILFQIHAGNYINHENRVSTWHSFAYNAEEFPENFTAMPPA